MIYIWGLGFFYKTSHQSFNHQDIKISRSALPVRKEQSGTIKITVYQTLQQSGIFTHLLKPLHKGRVCSGLLHIIFQLQTHQRISRNIKSRFKQHGRLRSDRSAAVKNIVQNLIRDTHLLGQLALREFAVLYLIFQHFTRMSRCISLFNCSHTPCLFIMIGQFYDITHCDYCLRRYLFRFHLYAVLIINTNRFQPCLIAYQSLIMQRMITIKILNTTQGLQQIYRFLIFSHNMRLETMFLIRGLPLFI